MKKKLLLIPLISLFSINSSSFIGDFKDKSNIGENEIDVTTLLALKVSFNKPLEFNATSKSKLLGTYRTLIQSDDSHYYNRIYVNNNLQSFISLKSDSEGNAYQEHLSINNEVTQNAMTDDKSNPISYSSIATNLFSRMGEVEPSDYDKYFTAIKENNTYLLNFNNLGESFLSPSLKMFFLDLDPYVWDIQTLSYQYKDLSLSLNEDLDITNMSFTKIKNDKYGGFKETFNVNISEITTNIGLSPLTPKMNQTNLQSFKNDLTNLSNELRKGNFSEHFEIQGTGFVYDNYYDFTSNKEDFPNMMLSNLVLEDPQKGDTYIGIVERNDGGYSPWGFSPLTNENDALVQDIYSSLEEFIPDFNNISSDFFSLKSSTSLGSTYRFDIASFAYCDFEFANELIFSMVGRFDPLNIYGGDFYVNNAALSYTFNYLDITIASNKTMTFTFNFTDEYTTYNSIMTFNNIGTTDLEKISSLRDGVAYIKSIYNGGN